MERNQLVDAEMDNRGLPEYADDEIDLRELFGVLWAGKWLLMAFTSVAAVIAIVVSLSLPDVYQSEALLAPTSGEASGLASMASRYGGLASLAGISLPGGSGGDKTALALEVIKSRFFIQQFIEQRELLVPLMAAQGWDRASGKLIINPDVYNADNGTWVREAEPPRQAKPSQQEAYKAFVELLQVNQDKTSGFVTVSVKHYSPVIAQQWVTWLVEDLNNTIRAQDVAEAEQSIEYLNEQIEATSLADLQAMFFEMIQGKTETIMLAKVRNEYLFKTVDPAVVAEQKSEPKRSLIVILATMLAGMLGVLFLLIRHYGFNQTAE